MPDVDGQVWVLLGLLDGSRTVDEVVTEVVHIFPDRAGQEVRAAIGELVRAGYVEDAARPVPPLSQVELERYDRSYNLWQWMNRSPDHAGWQPQIDLGRASVAVIGIGGVGASAALALVMSGVGHVHCIDCDVVDPSNLNRQVLYTERDVGRAKVDVAVERLWHHGLGTCVTGEAVEIDGIEVLRSLAERFDVVLLAADRPRKIRSWVNVACIEANTPWVHGGYHGPLIGAGMYQPGDGPCYDCFVAETSSYRAGTVAARWSPGVGVEFPHASNAVTAGMTGLLAAHMVMSLITGVPRLSANHQYGLNLLTLTDVTVIGPRAPSPACPTCGHREV